MSRAIPSSAPTPSSTGHWGPFDAIASAVSTVVQAVAPVVQATVSVAVAVGDAATGISSMVSDVKTIFSGNASQSCWNGNTGGAQMGYDAEGQLVHWQNAPGSTLGSGGYTTSVSVLYDGEGHRVEQQLAQFNCGQACGTTYTTTQHVAGGI